MVGRKTGSEIKIEWQIFREIEIVPGAEMGIIFEIKTIL